ncbi:MAG: dihydrodipicolinate reductase [Acidobacteriia bacterium]|nr:dihydrodipicolinate reductase [Terriglobia bacterium]
MRIALLGHGAMGRLVETRALNQGREIGLICTSKESSLKLEELSDRLRGHDVAIDFSAGNAVLKHATACGRAGVPLVEGTTGWKAEDAEVRRVVQSLRGGFLFGANFSIGVNLFYRVVSQAAELYGRLDEYDPFIEEAHHKRKRDAPSGTALHLREIVAAHSGREVAVTCTRAGYIPGTHRVGFDSAPDQIMLAHTARSREGFAAGALAAAQWIMGRQGVFEFSEVLEEILNEVKSERRDEK